MKGPHCMDLCAFVCRLGERGGMATSFRDWKEEMFLCTKQFWLGFSKGIWLCIKPVQHWPNRCVQYQPGHVRHIVSSHILRLLNSIKDLAQYWMLFDVREVWKTPIQNTTKASKLKVSKARVEVILLYGSDSWTLTKSLTKKLDGTTPVCFVTLWMYPGSHIGNKKLYNGLPPIDITRTISRIEDWSLLAM